MPSAFNALWALNPKVDYLNHGSFGATPRAVIEARREWLRQLESEPIAFLAPERELLPKLEQVRVLLASRFECKPRNLVFVRNATDGVNAVVRSFPFATGEEVLITNHGYNACNNAVRHAAEMSDANVQIAEIPFPLANAEQALTAIEAKLTSKTRLVVVDHVTSPSGIILPVAEIVRLVHAHGARVLIDGAHAPGMLPLNLAAIGADYYTANHHKWLCGPKASGFLVVQPQWQDEVKPTVISHGRNTSGFGTSQFQAQFNWPGTFDPSPILAMSTAIEFLDELVEGGMSGLMARNHRLTVEARALLLEQLDVPPPAPEAMLGSLATIPILRAGTASKLAAIANELKQELFTEKHIEVPVFTFGEAGLCVRISAAAYNSLDQYDRLAKALLAWRRRLTLDA